MVRGVNRYRVQEHSPNVAWEKCIEPLIEVINVTGFLQSIERLRSRVSVPENGPNSRHWCTNEFIEHSPKFCRTLPNMFLFCLFKQMSWTNKSAILTYTHHITTDTGQTWAMISIELTAGSLSESVYVKVTLVDGIAIILVQQQGYATPQPL